MGFKEYTTVHLLFFEKDEPMRILVIGQGGREHAIIKSLKKSPTVEKIHVIPGNPGMQREASCHSLSYDSRSEQDLQKLFDFCKNEKISLVVIGPEDPLVHGLSDRLREKNILVFGPSQEAAQLEGSKIFAKQFMNEAGIPTAHYVIVESVQETLDATIHFTPPYVLKAEGLAAGKGVFICKDLQELQQSAELLFDKKIFGANGERALLEQFFSGWEMSFFVFTNGHEYRELPIAQDHKRLLDQNKGPNTGGMGTVAPLQIDLQLKEKIIQQIVEPTVRQLDHHLMIYRGVIFFGLMITPQGPLLLEYNTRFGDPETQVLLPLIDGDTATIFYQIAQGLMPEIKINSQCATCVIGAAENYPDNPVKGTRIEGDLFHSQPNEYVIAAGVAQQHDEYVTQGGRVLGFVGLGSTPEESRQRAYALSQKIHWRGQQIRQDIGDYQFQRI